MRKVRRHGAAALAALAATLAISAAEARRRPSTAPAPAPAVAAPTSPPPEPPDPTRPAKQATSLGLGQCAPVLELMGRQTLTRPYDLQSGWDRTDPSHHVFQSVAALSSEKNVPPDGLAALVAVPTAVGGCEGVALQVFPLASSCELAEKEMLKTGRLLSPMMNTRIMLDGAGNRVILLPGNKETCIAISVDSHFGKS